jgi:hypothetical protein
MATIGYMFESGPTQIAQNNVSWTADITAGRIMAILTNTSPATHYTDWTYYNNVTGELTTANGYTAGGMALSSGTLGMVTDTYRYLKFGAANLVWSAPFTAGPFQYIVILKNTGTASTSPLLCYHDLGAPQTGLGGVFEYDFTSLGGVFRQKVPNSVTG